MRRREEGKQELGSVRWLSSARGNGFGGLASESLGKRLVDVDDGNQERENLTGPGCRFRMSVIERREASRAAREMDSCAAREVVSCAAREVVSCAES